MSYMHPTKRHRAYLRMLALPVSEIGQIFRTPLGSYNPMLKYCSLTLFILVMF